MFLRRGQTRRWSASVLVSAIAVGSLVGVVAGPASPAGALKVTDQPVSAVASSMWQTNNTVWALDAGGGVLYAGGSFTSVRPPGAALGTSETPRNRLAAFNASTGALITTFNPDVSGTVYDLDVSADGTKLYVAGSFQTVGGVTRQRIARLNLPSGTVDTAWSANASATVMTVASNTNQVFVGGDFTTIKGTARQRIAKLNTTNGNVVTAFVASSDKRITESAIAPDGSRVLVGGENEVINGVNQPAIASLDPTTGALMPWAATGIAPRPPSGGCAANLTDIIVQGTIAYATAEAPRPGCWEGYYAANIADGSVVYNEFCLGGSVGLAIANGWMYRGSHNHDCSKQEGGYVGPNSSANFVWYRLQAHRLSDGRLGHWSPNTNAGSTGTTTAVGPQVMATDGTQVFVGGDMSRVNTAAQQGLTRFGPTGVNSPPTTPTVAPRVTATGAGTLSISIEGVADPDDGELTYRLYRDGGTTPIATTTVESWPWSRPVLRFIDTGLTAGTTHSYEITASDGLLTTGRSPANTPVWVGWQNPADVPDAVAAIGATAHWQLDTASPFADSTPNGNGGVVVGGVTTEQPGLRTTNGGIALDGATGYVTSAAPITPTNAFSESAWFNTTTERGGAIMGFSDVQTGVGTLDNRAIWMDNDGKVVFGIRRGTTLPYGNAFVRSLGTYNDGQWHQVVGTYDGTNIALYVDGALIGQAAVTLPVASGPGYLRAGYLDLTGFYTIFGRNYDGAKAVMSEWWQGSLDEVSAHDAALTAAQVASLYASGSAHSAALPPEQPDPGAPPAPPAPSAYPATVLADTPSLYWRLNELAVGAITDSSPNLATGTFRTGLTYGQDDALTLGSDTSILSPGGSGIGYSNAVASGPSTYSLELFFKTTTATGGKLIGFESSRTGWGTTYDRHVYMSNAGRLSYGITMGAVSRAVESPAQYNNGAWHHLVATQGPAGMQLYVDGVLVASDATGITPDVANGYWRVGGGNLTGWPNQPSSASINATFDEVALYPTELTPAQVSAHFAARLT